MQSRILLEFILDEDVTPDFFAQRVALACSNNGALRIGEGVRAVEGSVVYTRQPDRPVADGAAEWFDKLLPVERIQINPSE